MKRGLLAISLVVLFLSILISSLALLWISLKLEILNTGSEINFTSPSKLDVSYGFHPNPENQQEKLSNTNGMLQNQTFSEINYFISPTGSDSNPGTIQKPFRTLQKARDTIRNLKKDNLSSNITVFLRDGKYYLESSFELTPDDSGTQKYSIIYRNYPKENPIIIGGKRIENWEKFNENIYRVHIGTERNIQIIIENGDLKTLAETPNKGYLTVAEKGLRIFGFHPKDLDESFDYSSASVYAFPANSYNAVKIPIEKIDWNMNKIYLMENKGSHFLSSEDTGHPGRYKLIGSLDFLDLPGEFYFDKKSGYLYYWPERKPISNQEIIYPTDDTVIKLVGRENKPVQNVKFLGLTVMGGDSIPLVYRQITVQRKGLDYEYLLRNAAFYLENTTHIEISDSKITSVGGFGIMMLNKAENNKIQRNVFKNIGHGAIALFGHPYSRNYHNKNNLINENEITDVGRDFESIAGIHLFFSGDNKIKNNILHNLPFNGIELRSMRYDELKVNPGLQEKFLKGGELISKEEHINLLNTKNNLISGNDISHVMEKTNDGGGVYLTGLGKNNIIDNNKIHNIKTNPPGWAMGIYMDTGSDYTTVKNNLIYGIDPNAVGIPISLQGIGITIENNILINERNGPNINIYDYTATYRPASLERRKEMLTTELSITRNLIISTYETPKSGTVIYLLFTGQGKTDEVGLITPWYERDFFERVDSNLFYFPKGDYKLRIIDYHYDTQSRDIQDINLKEWQDEYNFDTGSLVINRSPLDSDFNIRTDQDTLSILDQIGFDTQPFT